MKAAIVMLTLLLAGCQTGVTLPPLPEWQHPAGVPATVTASAVAEQARRLLPGVEVSDFSDAAFTVVNRDWLDAYLEWSTRAASAARLKWTLGSFDCKAFANLFSTVAGLSASRAGVEARPLLPVATVEWDGGQRHAMVAVATDAGPVIVEPQPVGGPRVWPLATYPRRILALDFGPTNPPPAIRALPVY